MCSKFVYVQLKYDKHNIEQLRIYIESVTQLAGNAEGFE